jgi:aldehyde dehydrogenase (NAD+)
MDKMRKEFSEALFKDLGKAPEANLTEIGLVTGCAQHAIKHLREYMTDIHEETELLLAPGRTYIRYEPLGVVGIYSAWNYPVLLCAHPLIDAIAAGNCCILKPSELAPNVSACFAKMVTQYLDTNHIVCIEGGIDVAVELNKQPLDFICFTGSTYVGKIIAETAAKNLTPCLLELGGKCPLVVHPTCDMLHTTEKIAFSKFGNSG